MSAEHRFWLLCFTIMTLGGNEAAAKRVLAASRRKSSNAIPIDEACVDLLRSVYSSEIMELAERVMAADPTLLEA